MLDERRKRFLRNVDIKNIRPNGILWIWGENVRTYQLTKEDIRYLRWYHKDSSIARDVDVKINIDNYRLAKDRNKYNKKCRTKKRIENKGPKKLIIVGSLVVVVIVGVNLFDLHQEPSNETSVIIEIPETYSGNEEYETDKIQDEEVSRSETIKHLCDIYQVDYDKTYSKLKELTNNFKNRDYQNGKIKGVTCKGYDVCARNEDELLTYAVRAIKQVPERFGLDRSIRIHNGYDSGDDYYAQISDVCELLGVDRNLMYAIVREETSFRSDLFKYSNNPAGLIDSNDPDGWWRFDTKEEGFLEFGMELLKDYKLIKVDPSVVDSTTVEKIGNYHAPPEDGNVDWLPNVLEILEYAQNNEEELFGGEEVHGLGR